jgi:hypothetical protein
MKKAIVLVIIMSMVLLSGCGVTSKSTGSSKEESSSKINVETRTGYIINPSGNVQINCEQVYTNSLLTKETFITLANVLSSKTEYNYHSGIVNDPWYKWNTVTMTWDFQKQSTQNYTLDSQGRLKQTYMTYLDSSGVEEKIIDYTYLSTGYAIHQVEKTNGIINLDYNETRIFEYGFNCATENRYDDTGALYESFIYQIK